MNGELNQILEAILQELKTIREELQFLKSKLTLQPFSKFNKALSATSFEQLVESYDETEEENALALYDWLSARKVTVKNYHQEEIADSTQFCNMLNSYAFLSSYRYNKHTKTYMPSRKGLVRL